MVPYNGIGDSAGAVKLRILGVRRLSYHEYPYPISKSTLIRVKQKNWSQRKPCEYESGDMASETLLCIVDLQSYPITYVVLHH